MAFSGNTQPPSNEIKESALCCFPGGVEQTHFLMLIRRYMKWWAIDPHWAKRKLKGKKVKEIKDMTSVKNSFIESKRKRKKKKNTW